MIRQIHIAFASAIATLALSGLSQTCAADDASSLTLFVQHPDGHEMRLEYHPGNGWRTQPGRGARRTAQQEVALRATAASAEEAPPAEGQPLSVFVDGPTGYVFVWNAEEARWNFVGHVAEPGR